MPAKPNPPEPEKPFNWRSQFLLPAAMLILTAVLNKLDKVDFAAPFRQKAEADSTFQAWARQQFVEVKAYGAVNRHSILNLQSDTKLILLNQEQGEANQEAMMKALDRAGVFVLRPRVVVRPRIDSLKWRADSLLFWAMRRP